MNNQLPYLIIGILIGLILASQCNSNSDDFADGEVIKRDTIVRIKHDTAVYLNPLPTTTIKTIKPSPTFTTLEYCQNAFDTLFISYNDTNYYEFDTLSLEAKIGVTENRIFKSEFRLTETETEITNTVVKKRFQILYGGGVSYPFGAYATTGFKTKKDLSILYNWHTNNTHSVGVVAPIKLK